MFHRILIAGDDALLPAPARLLLEAKGCQLKLCTSYAEAVGLILDEPPDLLLLTKDFDQQQDLDLIRAVKACLQKTNIPVVLVLPSEAEAAAMDWETYPVDDIMIRPLSAELLVARLQLAEARMIRVFDNNPLSKLPGNTSIIRAINKILQQDASYAVCYVDIDNFKPYNDRYGFTQGDDVILMVARIIVNVIEEMARQDSFIGHVGGDDFVFIVPEEIVRPVCEKILAHFETVKTMFISREDLAAGGYDEKDRQGRDTHFGLLSLSIAVTTTGGKNLHHYGEVSALASQLKHHVKQLEGSNYLIDRRAYPHS